MQCRSRATSRAAQKSVRASEPSADSDESGSGDKLGDDDDTSLHDDSDEEAEDAWNPDQVAALQVRGLHVMQTACSWGLLMGPASLMCPQGYVP